MFNLIKKDWRLFFEKSMIIFIVLYISIMVFIIDNIDITKKMTLIVITVSFLISLSSFAYDERNNSNVIVKSLPVTWAEIVVSKYLGLLINIIVSSIILVAFSKIIEELSLFNEVGINYSLLVKSIFGILVAASILFPVIFKYGYKKAKIINMIIFGTLYIFFIKMYTENGFSNSLVIFNSLIAYILIAILYLISLVISCKIYKND